jgi:hypothetical protein
MENVAWTSKCYFTSREIEIKEIEERKMTDMIDK